MINIVTLYNAYNVGAFLQAYSLYSVLKEKNLSAAFLDVGQDPEPYFWRNIKYIRNPIEFIFLLRQRKKYCKAVDKYLPVKKKQSLCLEDTIIIGSDEMWNINNGSFAHLQEYFGRDLECRRRISYAVSGNGTPATDLKRYDPTIDFSEFDSISVRDTSTLQLVSAVTDRVVKKVCDPTILFKAFNSYPIKKLGYDYVLVYAYPINLSENEKSNIKDYAKRNGLRTVSISLYNPWCDVNIVADPMEFLGYLEQAKSVVTSTFHGTLLSIIYNKDVYTYAHNNEKIRELLEDLELINRVVDNQSCYEDIQKIDYEQVNMRLNQMQKESERWLFDTISREERNNGKC